MADVKDFTIQFGRLVAYRGKEPDVAIPDGVTIIGRRAFYGNTSLVSVTIPAGVEAVEQEAFDRCSSLEAIHILAK